MNLNFPKITHTRNSLTYLKPVDSAAVDKRWELPESVSKCISDWAHTQHYMQIVFTAINEECKQCKGREVRILIICLCQRPNSLEKGKRVY